MLEVVVDAVALGTSAAVLWAAHWILRRIDRGRASPRIWLSFVIGAFLLSLGLTLHNQRAGRWDSPGIWYSLLIALLLSLAPILLMLAALAVRRSRRAERSSNA